MRKTITLEVEVTVDESVEQGAIQVAREHYEKVGGSRVPVDHKGERWRDVPPDEFIPDTVSAMMELVAANALLEEAGVEVTRVSAREGGRGETQPQVAGEAQLHDAPSLTSRPGEGTEADLDVFETGAYLCRWPNGDFSLVTANTRREALVQLDEWDVAHPSQLFPLESCMVDFRLNDLGEIELKQFAEETEDLIWETSYPELQALLSQMVARDGIEYRRSQGVDLPSCSTRAHEIMEESAGVASSGNRNRKGLAKATRNCGAGCRLLRARMATRILKSTDDRGGKPN